MNFCLELGMLDLGLSQLLFMLTRFNENKYRLFFTSFYDFSQSSFYVLGDFRV